MSEPSGRRNGQGNDSWERRAADVANEVQRWLIRSSARNMRDELGGQVKKAFRSGQDSGKGDVWATATTEPPDAADQPPECLWCPICRAARRMAQAQAQSSSRAAETPTDAAPKGAAPGFVGAADVLVGAARDALSGLDAILSYRPVDDSQSKPVDDSQSKSANGAPSNPPSSADRSSGVRPSGVRPSGVQPSGVQPSGVQPSSDRPSGVQGKEPDHEPDHRG